MSLYHFTLFFCFVHHCSIFFFCLITQQTIDIYEMCGEKLKAVLRANREAADKKNEELFAAKRAKMGDNEVSGSSATASATASASSVSGKKTKIKSVIEIKSVNEIIIAQAIRILSPDDIRSDVLLCSVLDCTDFVGHTFLRRQNL